jgi:hypothetical protein
MRMIIVAGFLTAALLMAAISAVSVDPPAWSWRVEQSTAGPKAALQAVPTVHRLNPKAG